MLADMTVLLDSDVLIAALHLGHPRHAEARPCLARAPLDARRAIVAAHSLAQVYRVLTTVQFGRRLSPQAAAELIDREVLPRCSIRSLSARRHVACIRKLSRRGLGGGAVYDGLIADVGRAAGVDRIVTFDVIDFRRVAPDMEVVAP